MPRPVGWVGLAKLARNPGDKRATVPQACAGAGAGMKKAVLGTAFGEALVELA